MFLLSEFEIERDKARARGKNEFGLIGDEVLIHGSQNDGLIIWNIARKLGVSCLLDKGYSFNVVNEFPNINKVITCVKMNREPFIYSNNFRMSKFLNKKFNGIPNINTIKDRINGMDKHLFLNDKLFISINFKAVEWLSQVLHKIVLPIKRLSPVEYRRKYEKCIICNEYIISDNTNEPMEIVHPEGEEERREYPDSFILLQFFNLPICKHHPVDFYKIALELKDNKFIIEDFVKNYKSYQILNKVKCKECNETYTKRVLSIPYCYHCIKDNTALMIEIALGTLNPNKIPDNYLRHLRCPDCNKALEREGLCRDCEQNYDWGVIEEDIDNGEFSWEDFMSNSEIRSEYRIEDRRTRETPTTVWRTIAYDDTTDSATSN